MTGKTEATDGTETETDSAEDAFLMKEAADFSMAADITSPIGFFSGATENFHFLPAATSTLIRITSPGVFSELVFPAAILTQPIHIA